MMFCCSSKRSAHRGNCNERIDLSRSQIRRRQRGNASRCRTAARSWLLHRRGLTENGLINWSDAHVFQLFEFLADPSGEQRIANLLGKALFAKTEISDMQYAVPFAAGDRAEDAANAYEAAIRKAGGLDAALIAVRQDGSLLMNHAVDADPFTHAHQEEGNGFLTVGLAAVMQTKHPIIVGIGKTCAQAVHAMLKGDITQSPLSALKLHPGATFILDEEASEML